MTTKQETILKIARDGWIPDLSVGNFPKIHKNQGSNYKNLEEALTAIQEMGVNCFSISAQRQDVLDLIEYAHNVHPNLVAGVHSLMDIPEVLEHAKKHTLYVPPTPNEAYRAGARILTALNGFDSETYYKFSDERAKDNDAVIIGGATTPNEWQDEWDKGANFVKFAGAELFSPNYMATYMPSLHNLIPFYVSGYFVKPEARENPEMLKTALSPYIRNAGGGFVGTFTFGLGYPFNSEKHEDIVRKGRLLLDTIKEIRMQTKTPSGLSVYEATASATEHVDLVKNTGRYFNA